MGDQGTFAARLRIVQGAKTQLELAEMLEIKQPSVNRLLTGENLPGFEIIARLAVLGWNANWLLTGKGPMMVSEMGSYPNVAGEVVAVAQRLEKYPQIMEMLIPAIEAQEKFDAVKQDVKTAEQQLKAKIQYPKKKRK